MLGIDYVPSAIEQARANAAAKGVDARFEVADAMDLAAEAVTTRSSTARCSTSSATTTVPRYVASLHGAVKPGGWCTCWPCPTRAVASGRRSARRRSATAFVDGWELEALDVTTYRGVVGTLHSEALGEPVGTTLDEPAWLARARRG